MKTTAKLKKESAPYIYQYYNIYAYIQDPLNCLKDGVVSIYNSFLEGLNNRNKLPRYVFMIPDIDILRKARLDFGADEILEKLLEWLFKKINKALDRRFEDLVGKRPGAMDPLQRTRIIWIKMINRPISDRNRKIKEAIMQRNLFNGILETLVRKEGFMYIMNVDAFDNYKETVHLFNYDSELNPDGKFTFWSEVNKIFQKFEQFAVDLKPKQFTSNKWEFKKGKGKKINKNGFYKKKYANKKFKLPPPP